MNIYADKLIEIAARGENNAESEVNYKIKG